MLLSSPSVPMLPYKATTARAGWGLTASSTPQRPSPQPLPCPGSSMSLSSAHAPCRGLVSHAPVVWEAIPHR